MSKFVIENGVLLNYHGPGGDVIIPQGVTAIADGAFRSSHRLTTVEIPDTVTAIGEGAFAGCVNLTAVNIPETVTEIPKFTFSGCEKLAEVRLSKGITAIRAEAFYQCAALTRLAIPDTVTYIGRNAFSGCKSLTGLIIPAGVTSLFMHTVDDCGKLVALSMNRTIFEAPSWKPPKANWGIVLTGEDKISLYAYAAKAGSDNISDFLRYNRWDLYDLELINNGPAYTYKAAARLLGSLGRIIDPVKLTDECREYHMDYLIQNAKKLIPIAESLCCPAIVEAMRDHGIINDKNKKAIAKLLAASQVPEIAAITL
jgi:hypothetical protein